MKKIAIDAMGGDHAPKAIVEGVNQAIEAFSDIEIQLYGDQSRIESYLVKSDRVSVVHTDEKINSDDEPAKAIRRKKNASMVLAARAVKDRQADAVLSAGNTGALLAAGLFIIGRIKGWIVLVCCQLYQQLMVQALICSIWVPMLKTQQSIYTNMLF